MTEGRQRKEMGTNEVLTIITYVQIRRKKKEKHLTLEGNTAKLSDSTGFKASRCHFMLPKAHQQPQERLMVQRCTTEIQAPTC